MVVVILAGGAPFAAGLPALSGSPDFLDAGPIVVLSPNGVSNAGVITITNEVSIASLQLTSNVQFLGQRWHVVVGYNGSEKIFDYNPDWAVKRILERAILAFRLTQGQPPLSLFNLSGVELPDMASADAAGIQPGDHLVLRPSRVTAGRMRASPTSQFFLAIPLPKSHAPPCLFPAPSDTRRASRLVFG